MVKLKDILFLFFIYRYTKNILNVCINTVLCVCVLYTASVKVDIWNSGKFRFSVFILQLLCIGQYFGFCRKNNTNDHCLSNLAIKQYICKHLKWKMDTYCKVVKLTLNSKNKKIYRDDMKYRGQSLRVTLMVKQRKKLKS